MSKFSSMITSKNFDKYFLIKFLPILFLAIFFSISYYTYFIFNDTLNAIENSKVKEVQESVKQISNGFSLSIKKQEQVVDTFLRQPGFKAAMDLYGDIQKTRRDSFQKFLLRKYNTLLEDLPYLKGYYCLSIDGTEIGSHEDFSVDYNKFIRSQEYKLLNNTDKNSIWIANRDADWLSTGSRKDVSIIYKVYDRNERNIVGYYILSIDYKILDTFYYKNNIDGISNVIILDRYNNPISTTNSFYSELRVQNILDGEIAEDGLSEVVDIPSGKYLIVVKEIKSINWKVLVYANKEHLTADLRKNITGHLIPIILYSLLISMIIFLESYLLLKVATDRQTMDYKLNLTNNMNDKLRMYKHDFMNHLQIISGLIELKFYDKAHEYIVNTANEGISINKYGDIGIPEIESIIYSAISKAIELEYEVEYDFIKLDDKLHVDTYDLSRILLNLTKNAIYALKESSNPNKKLSIKILSELGCYVFKISNNTPLIPVEIRPHIFDKGYSTKGNEGKGLGLYIVKRLVKKSGGILSLQVNEEGNHFIVSFPVDDNSVD